MALTMRLSWTCRHASVLAFDLDFCQNCYHRSLLVRAELQKSHHLSILSFTDLPLDMQLEIINRMNCDELVALMKTCKSMATLISKKLIMQRIKELVRMYLEPRGLYDLCIFKSILLLCGFEEAKGAHKDYTNNQAIQAHKTLFGGLLHLKTCKSWEQSFFRFILVAICPCRLLCFNFVKHFMDLPSLRKLTIEGVYHRASKLHRESLQSDRVLMMSNNNSQSAVSAFKCKPLLYGEWWNASYPGEQCSYSKFNIGSLKFDLAYMGYVLLRMKLEKQWGNRGDHEKVSLTADRTFVCK